VRIEQRTQSAQLLVPGAPENAQEKPSFSTFNPPLADEFMPY
jgi:hypothetical protein